MKRLLIDTSSLCWTYLLQGKDEENGRTVEHDGRTVRVNSAMFGYEGATGFLCRLLEELSATPTQMIFVVEGQGSKSRRVAVYKEYKASRDSRPPEAYAAFNEMKKMVTETFRKVGAQVVSQDGVEGDDVLAYLAEKLDGEKVIVTQDADLAVLLSDKVNLYRGGSLVTENPLGSFAPKFITVYKALVGDSSDNIKGAHGFGDKAFLDLLVNYGEGGLAALEGMIKRSTLHELEDDVGKFKPFRKVIDSAEMVRTSWQVAKLYPEWCNTERQRLKMIEGPIEGAVDDERVKKFGVGVLDMGLVELTSEPVKPALLPKTSRHAVFDCELIGKEAPVFLVCAKIVETGERHAFWHHVPGDMEKLRLMLEDKSITWVSFNGIGFDAPLISAALSGVPVTTLKMMAQQIIEERAFHWKLPDQYDYEPVEFDHIDLIEVAPGVRISLKTYAGRMAYPTMVDMPFHHDQDLDPVDFDIVEQYCFNDLGVTEALFQTLRTEIELRRQMSEEHGIDLRSKSDAQVAEAVLKKAVGITGKVEQPIPAFVTYKAPVFIHTDSPVINGLIDKLQKTQFNINQANGQVEAPGYLDEPLRLHAGSYQCGVGGLHSTHDKSLCFEAHEGMMISDFDVASYYPNIMLKAGLIPRFGNKGSVFIEEYRKIYDKRIEAKKAGNKQVANTLKIVLNGTFGKLGSMFSAFYSPDLMLAVTLTGQLNLLCLIHELEKIQGVGVVSANTDGIMVIYPPKRKAEIETAIAINAARTGFEYEETPYSKVALKDVNNYIAITTDRKAKRKGLYASNHPKENPLFLMKNPTMGVCADMAVEYLRDGIHPADAIHKHTDMADFVAIRNVKGGGIQYEGVVEVDDWILVNDVGTKDNEWRRPEWPEGKVLKRKSRPHPVEVGVGGKPFGRVARWHMTTKDVQPLSYVGSGNKVPKTEGAMICMTLPNELPADLDKYWYVKETLSMLADMGVEVEQQEVANA